LPPFVLTAFAFLDGGVARNVALKIAAVAVAFVTFAIVGWPVLSTLAASRSGCGWHVILGGFARQFDRPLGVAPAPYEVNREYLDEYIYTNVTSYAARVDPHVRPFDWCEAPYSVATRSYLEKVVTKFPADALVRTYASILGVVELPFAPAAADEAAEHADRHAGHGVGLAVVVAAIAIIMAASMRIGLFLVFCLLFVGGMPAIQFDHRHFFHLLVITWWAGGFLVQWAVTRPRTIRGVGRSALVLSACFVALVAVLYGARAFFGSVKTKFVCES